MSVVVWYNFATLRTSSPCCLVLPYLHYKNKSGLKLAASPFKCLIMSKGITKNAKSKAFYSGFAETSLAKLYHRRADYGYVKSQG